MTVVYLGNSAGKEHAPDGEGGTTPVPVEGKLITELLVPADSHTRKETIRSIWHDDGLWSRHSFNPEPDWVESDDPELAAALAAVFGCPVGRPDDWEATE